MRAIFGFVLFLTSLGLTMMDTANAGKAEAEDAVIQVLFEFDDLRSEQYLYTVRNDGYVKLTLDDGVTGDQLTNIVEKLESHPDIKGVLLRSADTCPN